MEIFLVGDIHGDISKIPKHKCVTILLGDTAIEQEHIEKISNMDCIVLIVNGNHDEYIMSQKYETVSIFEGKAKEISKNLFLLDNGNIFNIYGYRFWCMGGAQGTFNKVFPSMEDIVLGLENLSSGVDFIITHDIPIMLYEEIYDYNDRRNILNSIFDTVYLESDFKKWYAGHHHVDLLVGNNVRILYKDIVAIGGNNDKV